MSKSKMWRTSLPLTLIILAILTQNFQCAPKDEQVHMPIPGYNQHKWYSGYLNFDTGKYHYVYFESQRDPDNDPVVLWLNGGPGCSSLIGMLNENGPFTFKEGTNIIQVNKYAWNMKANLLYIQTPGGVGFSTGTRNNTYSDQTTTQDNLKAVIQFFDKFPTLKKNEFYISGQSYAGIYVPYLALQITRYNKLPNKEFAINLKGIMVGNACTDPRECYQPGDSFSIYQYQFLYEHAFLTQRDHDDIKATCIMGYASSACAQVRQRIDKKLSQNKFSLLNIYLKCFQTPSQALQRNSLKPKYKITQSGRRQNLEDWPNCDDELGIMEFLNEPLIHNYMHVDPIHYETCSDEVASRYTMNANASYWIYPLLMQQKLRVWVYSGDFDANVPIVGTLTWIKRLREQFNIPVHEPWREWWVPGLHKHEDQVGGMTWQLRGFTFASVKATGHMVPKDDKKAAFVLLDSFLNGNQLPWKSEE